MFSRSFTIFTLFGYDIKLDLSWFFIALLVVWSLATGYFPQTLTQATSLQILVLSVLSMLALFGSLILHELSHSLVAHRCGVEIKGITLFIFGGVAELKNEPQTPGAEFWIALAGPAMSFALAVIFWIARLLSELLGMPELVTALFSYVAWANAILAIFNLLPAFPMDGGRVMRAIVWQRTGDQLEATARATSAGSVLAYMLIGLGLMNVALTGQLGSLWIVIIGFFILASGRGAYENMRLHKLLEHRTARDVMTPAPVTVLPDETLATLVDHYILRRRISFVPVVDRDVLLGYIDLDVLRSIEPENWADTLVGDVYVEISPENTVSPDDPAESVLRRLSQTGRRKFLVVKGRKLQGVITLADLMRYLTLVQTVGARPHQAR
ncbi:site-2 protease family protein [Yoonia sp.]|uniref:site-2 protease family protein n=1 Tax=Yoonia sp. TaxID=2212373 RepID=UPI0019F734C0|nr:site-2 protease family protein [Yoonia sp.]MBE0413998.1 site-2 protease family protein [Yoonia sp.]